MYTLGYSFRPWKEAKAIADGPSILRLRPRDRARGRHRAPHPLPPPRGARRVVDRRRALDGRGRARPTPARRSQLTCGFLFMCTRLLPLRRGLHARVRGHRALRGPHRPPAALARGPRLRRQARRGDRQRRDRGDARPGDGRAGRARDDAAALAQLRRLAARRRTRSPTLLRRRAARQARLPDRALEERAADACRSSSSAAAAPELVKALHPQGRRAAAAGRLRHRHALQARATTPGTSASAWCPTATCSRRSATARASVVTDRIETFTENGLRLASGAELEADVVVTATGPQPARARRHADRRRRSRASSCRRPSATRA